VCIECEINDIDDLINVALCERGTERQVRFTLRQLYLDVIKARQHHHDLSQPHVVESE
jgi:hypothetical protein